MLQRVSGIPKCREVRHRRRYLSRHNDTQAHSRRDAQHCQGCRRFPQMSCEVPFQSIQEWVVKRPFQQWYEFWVTSSLLGQKFPHPLLGRRLVQYLHGTVRVQHACTAVVMDRLRLDRSLIFMLNSLSSTSRGSIQ